MLRFSADLQKGTSLMARLSPVEKMKRLRQALGRGSAFAIQGHPDEPQPSDLHVAIGYVPREVRRRPRRRKRKTTT